MKTHLVLNPGNKQAYHDLSENLKRLKSGNIIVRINLSGGTIYETSLAQQLFPTQQPNNYQSLFRWEDFILNVELLVQRIRFGTLVIRFSIKNGMPADNLTISYETSTRYKP